MARAPGGEIGGEARFRTVIGDQKKSEALVGGRGVLSV